MTNTHINPDTPDFHKQVEQIFQGLAYERPLFYRHPGGLRFELAEGGTVIDQFLRAMHKATAICRDLFTEPGSLVACIRIHPDAAEIFPFSQRRLIADLRKAGIAIPKKRQLQWQLSPPDEDGFPPFYLVNLYFELPAERAQNLLWCRLGGRYEDFEILPEPRCMIYLFNLKERVMVWPYDMRGMDVVGPNHQRLGELYRKFNDWLLDYDRATMDACFQEDES